MKKNFLFLIFGFAICFSSFAKITFENPDINEKDEVIFAVSYDSTGLHSYRSVFYSKLKSDTPTSEKQLLTCFPEQMELLSLMGKPVLQIRNRYGTARYYTSTNSVSWINQVKDLPLTSSVTTPYSTSSDGKWICYVEKNGIATGNLVLESVANGRKFMLGDEVLRSYEKVPVKWSPDGAILLYEKKGNVYFCSPDALNKNVEVEERYRKIGRGTINSVEWASEKFLVYIDDYMVYRINARGLYTTGLYSEVIGQGTPIGRLPFQFNASRDEFSVSPDISSLVLAQERKNFTYFRTLLSSCDYMDIIYSKPYTDSAASLADYEIFWDKFGNPILWQMKLPYNSTNIQGSVVKLGERTKALLEIVDSGKPCLSPDKTKAAFFAGNTVYIYDINSWEQLATLSGEKVISLIWENKNSLYVGGSKTIRRWNIPTAAVDFISVSSPEFAFWDKTTGQPIAEVDKGRRFIYSFATGKWDPIFNADSPELNYQNGRYRVFCGTTSNPLFENALYVRTLSGKSVTKQIYDSSVRKMKPRAKVALIFDAYDNADGLPKIISSLKKFDIPGTFFINGEFIRRYPAQTKQISLNNFECGSMFFTATDLTDSTFIFDTQFITRGLGRNEDEFLACTGNELSLFWHAPFYKTNQNIIEGGNAAGYEYIKSIHLHSDNVPFVQLGGSEKYFSPEQLIEEYIDMVLRTNGGVIPVTIGVAQGGRPESLWEYIDLLVNALVDANFELVTVSQLMN